jgi:hypothetical protein
MNLELNPDPGQDSNPNPGLKINYGSIAKS